MRKKVTLKVKNKQPAAIAITGEYITLDAFLKFASVCSTGGQAKQMIADGQVFVGGAVCLQRGKKLRSGDEVGIGGAHFKIIGQG